MRVIEATLIRHVSAMGGTEMRDDVPIGKRYQIDADSIDLGWRFVVASGERIPEEMVLDVEAQQWLPTGVLSFYA